MAGGIEFDMEPRRFLMDSVGGLSVQYEDEAALAKMAAQAARRVVDVVFAAGTLNGSEVPDIGPEPHWTS